VTGVKVVDASAVAALLFGEPEAEAIAKRFGGAKLVAPSLLVFELANVCLVKTRRHPEQELALVAAFGLRTRLAVQEAAVDHEGVLALAASTGLTGYDASYLWLAQELGAELVTLDRRLAGAAESVSARASR
jgi:predicted nucleic acid-binding protein